MMVIEEIYKRFKVPPNLAKHMLTVTRVVCNIRDHWQWGSIKWDFVIKAALLHDIGNIVKFNFETHPEFLGEEVTNIEYWKKVQTEITEKYGIDDHIASGRMLQEIGVDSDLLDLIQNKSFSNAIEISTSSDWSSKILLYADMRVMPHGVSLLEERLSDVRNRMPQYTNRPDFETLLEAARNIERQIESRLDATINEIDWEDIRETDEKLLTLAI